MRVRPFALVGGLAVSIRTEPRFTRDVDLAVAVPGDDEAERLTVALSDRGWRVTTTLEHPTSGRLAAVRLELPRDAGGEAEPADLALAREGSRLVVERGFHRGIDLVGEVEALVSEEAGRSDL